MEHERVSHATFVVERVYPDSPPARVFAAYADREAKARWSTGPKHWRTTMFVQHMRNVLESLATEVARS
ncbi:MAG TPA: hypothetical protein VEX15_00165 [Nocardioidaceae bacterium]|nr:hypothetical protein [Nocardioidaceae bacterium]